MTKPTNDLTRVKPSDIPEGTPDSAVYAAAREAVNAQMGDAWKTGVARRWGWRLDMATARLARELFYAGAADTVAETLDRAGATWQSPVKGVNRQSCVDRLREGLFVPPPPSGHPEERSILRWFMLQTARYVDPAWNLELKAAADAMPPQRVQVVLPGDLRSAPDGPEALRYVVEIVRDWAMGFPQPAPPPQEEAGHVDPSFPPGNLPTVPDGP